MRSQRWKLILYPGLGRDYVELYDLESDPAERRNVADASPRVRDEHRAMLTRWGGGPDAAPRRELEPEVRDGLRALGYAE